MSHGSTPQLPFKKPEIPFDGDHEALNRDTLGGLSSSPLIRSYMTPVHSPSKEFSHGSGGSTCGVTSDVGSVLLSSP